MTITPEELEDAARRPQSVTIDNVTVQHRPLADQIAIDRYTRERRAADDPWNLIRRYRVDGPPTSS